MRLPLGGRPAMPNARKAAASRAIAGTNALSEAERSLGRRNQQHTQIVVPSSAPPQHPLQYLIPIYSLLSSKEASI